MSQDPEPLTLTLDEQIRALIDAEMEAYCELEIYATGDDAKRSLEGFAQEVREAVEARDEAAELRAENKRLLTALHAADAFISHEYHRNTHRLTDEAWAKETLDKVTAITRRRYAEKTL